jgi:hypothetical protein
LQALPFIAASTSVVKPQIPECISALDKTSSLRQYAVFHIFV